MKGKTLGEQPTGDNGPGSKDLPEETVTKAIRERSAALQLLSQSDILALLKDNHPDSFAADSKGDDTTVMIAELIRQSDDLGVLPGAGSRYYYSSRFMTEAYATILLHKLEGPRRLIAETVRQSAREYERPVPLSIFTRPPFDLRGDEVLDCLATMEKDRDCADIRTVATSTSVVYLYSTSHLEPEHAAMLAEWFEVGQYDSP